MIIFWILNRVPTAQRVVKTVHGVVYFDFFLIFLLKKNLDHQNKVYFIVGSFSNNKKFKPDSIDNFRPKVDFGSDSVLYLTEEYSKSLDKFLGDESTELGEGGIMNPSRPKGESIKRFQFLRPYIPVQHGHWQGWLLETHPEISIIELDNTLTKAKINFRVGYEGGEALIEKTGDNWKIISSKVTWIE